MINHDDDYEVRDALIDLYLSVKIRSNDEIDQYNHDVLHDERVKLKSKQNVNKITLINYIKASIEILMNMKSEEFLANNRKILLGREKESKKRYCEKCKIKLDLKKGGEISVGASGRISPSSDRFFSKSIVNEGDITHK